jgi:hypothetical protein
MFNTPPLFHTVPGARPAADVGKLLKCKQFICVVFAAVDVIPLPIINEQSCCVVLHFPPSIVDKRFIDVLDEPPPTNE